MNNTVRTLVLTILLSFCYVPVYANHGVDAIGYAVALFGIIALIVIVLTIISFVISIRNISRKSKKLRVISFLFSLPMFALSLLVLKLVPLAGFICLLIFLLLAWLIYKSMAPPDAKSI